MNFSHFSKQKKAWLGTIIFLPVIYIIGKELYSVNINWLIIYIGILILALLTSSLFLVIPYYFNCLFGFEDLYDKEEAEKKEKYEDKEITVSIKRSNAPLKKHKKIRGYLKINQADREK